jgi:hypothetical protein
MSFIHPLLLGGLALMSLPVIIHLIMRQQPKRLIFPAFRFLKQQLKTNQRKLRLRHWLLLAFRMLLIALMCLALARPRLFSERLAGLNSEQAAIVALVMDTSPTMEYTAGGKTRLDEGRARALELLDELGPASKIAVIDSAEPSGDWLPSVAAARERLMNLQIRAANQPATAAIDGAYRLLQKLDAEANPGEVLPRFIYVVSDRTPNAWDNGRANDLKAARDRLPDPKPKCVYLDVGVDQPVDVAVADVEVRPQVNAANKPIIIRATVQATGQPAGAEINTELLCRLTGEVQPLRMPVRLKPGDRQVIEFERRGLPPGMHQAEVWLVQSDSLPGNNARFVTFEIRKPRKVLVICDSRGDAEVFRIAIDKQGLYVCDVKSTTDPGFSNLTPDDLAAYEAICLLSVGKPGQGGQDLWEKLERYVLRGGGLVVLPGGEGLDRDDYTKPNSAASRILPGQLKTWEHSKNGVTWVEPAYQHPLMALFRKDAESSNIDFVKYVRHAFDYWIVQPDAKASVLVRYSDKAKSPALLERVPDGAVGRGRVLLATTPFDERRDATGNKANDYNADNSFFFTLANRIVAYLAGATEDANFNHTAGTSILIPLPPALRFGNYVLQGPGLTGSDAQVQHPADGAELRLTQPQQVGHYSLTGPNREPIAAFSLNMLPAESLLLPRLGVDVVEDIFGPKSVVPLGQNRKLKDALEGQLRQPIDLFPWLMLLLLFTLAIENLLANKFYRQAGEAAAESK